MNPGSTDPTGATAGRVLGHGSDESPQALRRRLDAIAQLLHQAARVVWARADEDGPRSSLYSLGLGIHLAHGQTLLLLPADLVNDGTDLETGLDLGVEEPSVRTAVQLLTEVEELSQPLPMWRADLVYGSQLVVDVCDLLREAQRLDC